MAEPPRVSSFGDSKAQILLKRERELFDLRRGRARAEEWLRALHRVWPERLDDSLEALARRALELLVDTLSFDVAVAIEYQPESERVLFACRDPELPSFALRLERGVAAELESQPSGIYPGADSAALAPLAAALELEKFLWSWRPSHRQTRFLFVAGSGARTAQLHTLSETDRKHFEMYCSHAAALLSNSLLVADVAFSSRQAGMAEIATGILHNVGNVLNSVNVCGEMALRHARELPADKLGKLLALLDGQADLAAFFANDPRAPKALEYLRRLAQHVSDGQRELGSELGQLSRHVAHVAAIVSRQQEYARTSASERCQLPRLMDDALMLVRASHPRSDVEIVRVFAPDAPELVTDRHRALQILVNLISNALWALDQGGAQPARLVARIERGEGAVRLEIEDNGVGIALEDAGKVFQHGYTTRRDGHGFGLHTSQLTAQELGGRLSFVSAGRERGARFTLALPLEPPCRSETAADITA
ncbi:MAG: ATP-binding protein [Polyangiaceae bacterium]